MEDERERPLGWGKHADTPIYDLPEAYVGWALARLLGEIRTKVRQCRALQAQLDELDEACQTELAELIKELHE